MDDTILITNRKQVIYYFLLFYLFIYELEKFAFNHLVGIVYFDGSSFGYEC